MLEIRGSYSKDESAAALNVLAQLDHRVMHIWHQSDPFYFLFSSSDFSIHVSQSDRKGFIRFKQGGWIETNDLQSLASLKEKLKSDDCRPAKNNLKSREAILFFTILLILFSIWFLSQSSA